MSACSMHLHKHTTTYTDGHTHRWTDGHTHTDTHTHKDVYLSLIIGEVWIDDCDPGWEEIIDTPNRRTRGWCSLATPNVYYYLR